MSFIKSQCDWGVVGHPLITKSSPSCPHPNSNMLRNKIFYHLIPLWGPSRLWAGGATPWIGRQLITGLKHWNKQPFTLSFTPDRGSLNHHFPQVHVLGGRKNPHGQDLNPDLLSVARHCQSLPQCAICDQFHSKNSKVHFPDTYIHVKTHWIEKNEKRLLYISHFSPGFSWSVTPGFRVCWIFCPWQVFRCQLIHE